MMCFIGCKAEMCLLNTAAE